MALNEIRSAHEWAEDHGISAAPTSPGQPLWDRPNVSADLNAARQAAAQEIVAELPAQVLPPAIPIGDLAIRVLVAA